MFQTTDADEACLKRLRLGLADFFADSGICEGVAIELRVAAMIQFAAAGLVCMPMSKELAIKSGVELFIGSIQELIPGVEIKLDVQCREQVRRKPEEVH